MKASFKAFMDRGKIAEGQTAKFTQLNKYLQSISTRVEMLNEINYDRILLSYANNGICLDCYFQY